ncbi:ABC-2 transporter permease [Christensenella tenuis]|jgi:ABC-2 type transport system permease protein|uniref:ABC-2 transporter permease n=1 Tax=Christensenella tenuis TaxID=2763033 RepID=A0ABR7EF38_9FIRM|nr:ABC-2 transporter permease [Christensenella tenuis]MBC5648404.1 ABC-2 transporter permease [Christensenella tenuis]
MRGLLLKEFLGIRSFFKMYAFIIAICIIPVAVAQDGTFSAGFAVGICTFVGIMMCFISFNYDTGSKWDKFVLTLPFTREQIVRSKYLFSLIMVGVGMGLGLALSAVLAAAGQTELDAGMLLTAGFLAACALLSVSLIIPLVFRFGVEKSRIIVIVIFLVPFMTFIALAGNGAVDGAAVEGALPALARVLPVCGAAALVVSYLISVHIYRKKEV